MPCASRIAIALPPLLLLAACGKPQPEPPKPPAPQSAAHAELRDAIQQPIDRAKAVDAQVQEGADAQRKAIEDAGG